MAESSFGLEQGFHSALAKASLGIVIVGALAKWEEMCCSSLYYSPC